MKIFKYGLVFLKGEKLLLLKKRGLEGLITPGGKPEGNENYKETLIREIKEETSGELDPSTLEFLGSFEDETGIGGRIMIELFIGDVKGDLGPSMEIEELVWVRKDFNRNRLSPLVRNKILPFLIDRGYMK